MARVIDASQLDDERKSQLEDLAQRSELGLAANVSPEAGAVTGLTGWFAPPEDTDPLTWSAEFLGEARASLGIPEDVALDDPRGVETSAGSTAIVFDAMYEGATYYGCGALVALDEALNVRSVTCRWPRQQVHLGKRKPSPARAKEFVRDRAFTEESGAESVPEPTLEIWDPMAVLGEPGDPEPVFVFRFDDAELPADVLVDVTGSRLVEVVTGDPNGNPSSTHVTPRYHLNPATGVPDFVSFEPNGLLLPEAMSGNPTQVARAFFAQYPKMFGTGDPERQLVLKDVVTDPDVASTHVIFEQRVGPYPVYGCELRVHLTPSLAIRSISGNYMRVPDVPLVPTVDEEAAQYVALATAPQELLGWNGLPALPDELIQRIDRRWEDGRPARERGDGSEALSVARHGLVILPLKLARDGGGQNHLAWWFSTPEADTFVSASDGTLVYEISKRQEARLVYDAQAVRIRHLGDAVLELVDGVERTDVTELDTESRPADAAMGATEAFWRIFGRNGWNGGGANSVAYVEVNLDKPETEEIIEENAVWSADKALFSRNFAVPDVVGHELTHGLVQATAGLRYRAESGAINESYSDVFAELIFPESNPRVWRIGVGLGPNGGPIRDLANPTVANYAQYLMTSSDNGGVHTNSGIGNKAAVLICDGDGTAGHPGIGRQRLARLYWDVLTTRLHPWASYIDVLSNTWQAARDAVALRRTGIVFPGTSQQAPAFDANTSTEVLWAFRQVGLDLALSSGWFEVPGGGTSDHTFNSGVMAPPEERVSDAEVRLVRRRGNLSLLFQGVARVSTGGTVSDGAGTTATIISHGVGTRNKEMTARVTTPNFEPLEVSGNVFTVQVAGPDVPPPTNPYLTGGVVHWFDNPFFAGRRYGDIIYQNTQLPAGNVVSDVVLELLNRQGGVVSRHRFGDPAATWGGTGASIFSRTLGGTALEVRVRSWHDFGWAVRYQLLYFITGLNVSLPPFTISEVGYEGVDPMVVIGGF
jgi:hypothetical protein